MYCVGLEAIILYWEGIKVQQENAKNQIKVRQKMDREVVLKDMFIKEPERSNGIVQWKTRFFFRMHV